MRIVLATVLMALLLLVPLGAWSVQPLGAWAGHGNTWWYNHTPRCWGPLCVDVYGDHVVIEVDLPLPSRGDGS